MEKVVVDVYIYIAVERLEGAKRIVLMTMMMRCWGRGGGFGRWTLRVLCVCVSVKVSKFSGFDNTQCCITQKEAKEKWKKKGEEFGKWNDEGNEGSG